VESRPSGGGLSRLRLVRGGARPGVAEGEGADAVPAEPAGPGALTHLANAGRAPFRLIKDVFNRVIAHNATGSASQFAYNAVLATVPFLFVLVSAFGIAGSATTYDRLLDTFGNAIPPALQGLLQSSVRSATRNSNNAAIFLAIGVVAAIYVTSNVIGTLMNALDEAYGVPHRPWFRGKLVAIGFAAATSVLVALTTLLLVVGPRLIDAVADYAGLSGTARDLAKESVFPIGVAALVLFTLLLYRFGPNGPRPRLPTILPGALVAVGGWLGMTQAFRAYVDHFSYGTVYGSLATVVVYLLFLYLTGLILLVGAEVNGELAARRAARGAAQAGPPAAVGGSG
jgi:membrane protein